MRQAKWSFRPWTLNNFDGQSRKKTDIITSVRTYVYKRAQAVESTVVIVIRARPWLRTEFIRTPPCLLLLVCAVRSVSSKTPTLPPAADRIGMVEESGVGWLQFWLPAWNHSNSILDLLFGWYEQLEAADRGWRDKQTNQVTYGWTNTIHSYVPMRLLLLSAKPSHNNGIRKFFDTIIGCLRSAGFVADIDLSSLSQISRTNTIIGSYDSLMGTGPNWCSGHRLSYWGFKVHWFALCLHHVFSKKKKIS